VENELKVEKKKGYFVYLVAFVASFGGFLFGYNLLLMSGEATEAIPIPIPPIISKTIFCTK